ncbi:MAG TPA: hypothetical protein VHX60_01725 [Acidobacteriaceae bacterium]|jgi:hypothetical protein|nr:hypothetical protein [Acidobacteriaceae bacterium]
MGVSAPVAARASAQNANAVARAIEDFLATWPRAAIFEDGRLLFDLRLAHYSLTSEHGRCLLHLWSEERNLVRTVASIEPRRQTLRLETRRFGQTKPQILTLVPDPDFRTPTGRDTSRRRYLRTLEEALGRHFPEWKAEGFRSAMDLEHSFGPAYARGIVARGQRAWAVLGVGPEEPAPVVDGALTLGILWLAWCREHSGGRRVLQGLRLVVPRGNAAVAAARMAWLNPAVAQWELYELDASTGAMTQTAVERDGNLDIQLAHAFDPTAALERSAAAVDHLGALLPPGLRAQTEIRPSGATEIGFSLHGLEYARVLHRVAPGSFQREDQIVFGAGPSETLLDEDTEDLFRDLVDRLFASRAAGAAGRDALYRLQPERWLESMLRRDLSLLDPLLGGGPVYSQVPAVASTSRSLLDLLTVTRRGRLAVLELKADDDLHLPLQALDYWMRVRALHRAGILQARGYFAGVELAEADPLLLLVAPALHLHPANETVLRHFAHEVPWEFIAVDEHWREGCRVVLRKRSGSAPGR